MSNQSRILISPNGTLAANYGGDQPVRLRDAVSLEPHTPPLRIVGATTTLTFSADSQWLATGGADGKVQVWSATSGDARWMATAQHTSRVYTIAFHPKGTILASGSDDNTVRFWDATTGQPLFAPIRHEGAVYWLSFSADGNTLCSASIDGTSRVWDTSTGEPITPKLPAWNGQPWKDDLDVTAMSVNELLCLTQALNGMEVDKQGGMTLLDAHIVSERYRKVENKSEQTYIPTDDVVWHEYHAQAAENLGQWYAAAWQLERLTRLDAKSVDYRRRLARAWSQLGAWNKVIETTTQLLRTNPNNIDGWLQRGQAYGELKQWRESIADIAQGVRLQQLPQWRRVMPAFMKLDQGDAAGFEKECLTLSQLGKLEGTDKLAIATVAVSRPLPAAMMKGMQPWVDEALKAQPQSVELQLLQAALLIRTSQAETALTMLKAIPTTSDREAMRLLWQALAEQQQGKSLVAQVTLQKAKELLAGDTGSLHSRAWQDEAQIRALTEEAEGRGK